MSRIQALVFLALSGLFSWFAAQATGQAMHRILNDRNRFLLEDIATRKTRPFDMWVTRLANALMDSRFTDRVVANLDDYLRYGVNTLEVSIQGGNLGYGKNGLYPRVYSADGTLDLESGVWTNLKRLLEECDRRGMVMIIQFWYHLRDHHVPDDSKAMDITRKAAEWLKNTGRRNYILDVVNEFDHNAFEVPGKKGVKRPLFSTLEGALTLLEIVFEADPGVMAGMSPTGALLCPEGWLDNPPRGKRWIEARIILGHNQVADPMNPASYKLGSVPRDPRSKPYVNTEFYLQLRYEKTARLDPRTQLPTYGHWDPATIQSYITDMKKVIQLGGYTNVFSHHQQYVARDALLPVAAVGPASTQPESSPGAGEPSMHWLFREISRLTRRDPLSTTHDFNAGAPGVETDLEGTWVRTGGMLCQTDPRADPAWARMAMEEGDVEISFEADFLSPPGPSGRLGIQIGAAAPAGPAYRLQVAGDRITLDQVGGALPTRSMRTVKRARNQYVLRLSGGRVQVRVDGYPALDVADPTPLAGRNLLFFTQNATASFDNVRASPIRKIDFDDETTGDWEAVQPIAWKVVVGAGNPGNKVWEGTAPGQESRHAVLDRLVKDFDLSFIADLRDAASLGVRFRAGSVKTGSGPDYSLTLEKSGAVSLVRREASGPPTPIAASSVKLDPSAISVRILVGGGRIVVEVDGKPVLDGMDASEDVLEAGGIGLVATSGKVRFDDLHLTVTPNRFPTPRFLSGTGPSLPAGFAVEITDPDGLMDLGEFQLLLDLGNEVVVDVTFFLIPTLGIFRLEESGDGKGIRFTLNFAIDLGTVSGTFRARAVDRPGNAATAGYEIKR